MQIVSYISELNKRVSRLVYLVRPKEVDIFLWIFNMLRQIQVPRQLATCSARFCDKNGHFWVFVPHTYFVFLTPLQIFVPPLEIILFINHYFLVCIFRYRTSSCINYGLEIQGYCVYSNNLRRNSTKNVTADTTAAEGKCVLVYVFIGWSSWPL